MEQTTTGAAPVEAARRQGGVAQGLTIAFSNWLPILVVLALPPVLPGMVAAFHDVPQASKLLPLVVALPGLIVAILSWPAGLLIDRFGRRGPLLAAITLFAVVGVLPVFLTSLTSVLVSRVGMGLAQSVIMVACGALLADYFAEDKRRTWLTVQGIVMAVLAPVSAVLAGVAGGFGWNYAFLLYALALPILLACFVFCFEPNAKVVRPEGAAPAGRFPALQAVLVGGVSFLASIFFFLFVIHAGLVFKAVGVEDSARIGSLIGLTTLGSPLGTLLFNLASRKLPISILLGMMVLILSVGTLGIGLSTSLQATLAFGFLQQLGGGMALLTIVYWTAHVFTPEHMGQGMGVFNGAFFFGQFFCALALNAAEGVMGGILPAFALLGGLGVVGAAVTVLVTRAPKASPSAASVAEPLH